VLFLRHADANDEQQVKDCYQRSSSIHQPWVYPPEDYEAFLSAEYRYFLCLESSREIVGTFNISGIVRGYFQSAYLGYEIFSPHHGKGYMTRGIKLLLSKAFEELKLHRLEANIQPNNKASIRLVSRAGFEKEGYSKNYLNIAGLGWKDHERWAMVNPSWKDGVS